MWSVNFSVPFCAVALLSYCMFQKHSYSYCNYFHLIYYCYL